MILTVEVKIDGEFQKIEHAKGLVDEVAISFDEKGLELLLEKISSLKGKKRSSSLDDAFMGWR